MPVAGLQQVIGLARVDVPDERTEGVADVGQVVSSFPATITDDSTEAGRKKNRRVEVSFSRIDSGG